MIQQIHIEKYREDILRLWQKCFGDSREYISFFLDNCPQKICFADIRCGKVVSMLFLLDGAVNDYSCKYIYAACTAPEWRKCGLMGNLLRYTLMFCQKSGIDAVFLVPGNSVLYDYYKKFGFISCFYRQELLVRTEAEKSTCPTDDSRLSETRNKLLKTIDAFRFTAEITDYIIKENHLNGNGSVCICGSQENSIAFYTFSDGNLTIREFLSDQGFNSSVLSALSTKYHTENIYIRCPIVYNNIDNPPIYTKCGMLYPINAKLKKQIANGAAFYAGMYLD